MALVMFSTGNISDLNNWYEVAACSKESNTLIESDSIAFTSTEVYNIKGMAFSALHYTSVGAEIRHNGNLTYALTISPTDNRMTFFPMELTIVPGNYTITFSTPILTADAILLPIDEHPTTLLESLYILDGVATWDLTDNALLDVFSTATIKLAEGGDYKINANLLNYGKILAGTTELDYPQNSTATLTLHGTIGELGLYGRTKTTLAALAGDVLIGADSIQVVNDWQVGDTIYFPDENRIITDITGTIVELDSGLT